MRAGSTARSPTYWRNHSWQNIDNIPLNVLDFNINKDHLQRYKAGYEVEVKDGTLLAIV